MPRLAARVAESADRFVQARGRYVQAVHVLGELNHTIACDISRAREEIGYDPPTALFEGMRESIRWALANGEAL
jgi:nucleoside-diphosphate-sugar epimerase